MHFNKNVILKYVIRSMDVIAFTLHFIPYVIRRKRIGEVP
jgi:hypothetical protein